MKNLFAFFAIVLLCGYSFAQNTATTTQVGDNGLITVEQDGSLNAATVTQTETASNTPIGQQIATVKQTGTSNSAVIEQTETGGGGHSTNKAYIEQIGSSNISLQTTYAPGYNSGQSVWAFQDGSLNDVRQDIQSGYTNSFKSTQYGTENDVLQIMSANHSHGIIFQDGEGNYAEQILTGSNHGYSGGIKSTQIGNSNKSYQTFSGGGLGHSQKGEVWQEGDGNYALQMSSGLDNIANTYQFGDANTSNISMSGNSNFSDVDQLGNSNLGNISQIGNGNSGVISQNGNNNSSTVTQQP